MQGELADTNANVATLNNQGNNEDMPVPGIAVQQAFNKAAIAVKPTSDVAGPDAINTLNETHMPTIGRIIERSSNGIAITSLNNTDWAARQLIETMRPQPSSTIDSTYSFMEGISDNRSDAMKNMLAIDQHLQPLTEFIQQSMEKNMDRLDAPSTGISAAEQSRLAQESMRETARESMLMQGLVMEANSKIVAASMNVNIAIAIYRWVKELATGVVKIVKNTINNTR